jgi:hypothetical protein
MTAKEIDGAPAPRVDRKRHQPARVARSKKTGGLDRDVDLIEQAGAGRTTRSRGRARDRVAVKVLVRRDLKKSKAAIYCTLVARHCRVVLLI